MDPLRPFVSLLNSLMRPGRTARIDRASGSNNAGHSVAARSQETLRLRLRNRIAEIGIADEKRARDVFVSTVLAWQFGDHLQRDPQFSETVRKLSDHIGEQPAASERLHTLLVALTAQSSGS